MSSDQKKMRCKAVSKQKTNLQQVLRLSGPRRDKKPNFLKNRAKVRFTDWTKLGWNYFIVTYHRVKN